MIKLVELLNRLFEGVYDPGILKAVFMAGGSGSGKTFVVQGIFGVPEKINISYTGLKLVNSDQEFESLLKKYGFGLDFDNMPEDLFNQLTSSDIVKKGASSLRGFSKELTGARMKLYMNGRLGMIIDGTAHSIAKTLIQKKELEKVGYDTYMIFVNTTLDIALKRNMARERKVKPEIVSARWHDVQANIKTLKSIFGSNFFEVDNSKYLSEKEAKQKFATITKQHISTFINASIKNPIGKKWIKKQLLLKKRK